MAKGKQTKTNDETKQIKITLSKDAYENLQTACAFVGMSKSEYIEKLLSKKFKRIKDETTRAEMKKILKI